MVLKLEELVWIERVGKHIMEQYKLEIILNELISKSEGVKDGLFAPEIFEIPLKEIENYDFFIFKELQKIERELWSSESTYSGITVKKKALILQITNEEKVKFIPKIVKNYLKEIKNV
mgnify:FL=1